MAYPPPEVVQDAFLAPTSHIVRRCEIYENDGSTPWRPENWDRLIDGSVTADYSRDERRAMELKLDNYDRELDHSPTNLWYDKVFKIFYGINVNESDHDPYIIIMEEFSSAGEALNLKKMLNAQGYTRVRINTTVTTYAQLEEYDIIISIAADFTRKLALIQEAYNKGKSVFTFSLQATAAQLPEIIGSAAVDPISIIDRTNLISPNLSVAHELNSGWARWGMHGVWNTYESFDNLDDWTRTATSLSQFDSVTRHSATQSLKIPAGAGMDDNYWRIVDVRPNDNYTFAVYATKDAAYNGTSSNSKLRVTSVDGSTFYTAAAYDAAALTVGTFTRRTVTFAIPAGVTQVRVQLRTDHTAGNLWLDDVEIRHAGVTTPFRKILTTAPGVVTVGQWWDSAAGGFSPGAMALQNASGERWVHLQQVKFAADNLDLPENCEKFIGRALQYLDTWEPTAYWEAQIGEFMIDSLATDETGDTISVSGRDYTTRCLNSKFVNSTGYAIGTNIGTIIKGIASNAGITKFSLPIITETLPRDLVYERGTERWKAMKEIADASSYEIFFDSSGFMVMRKYQDPLLSPPTLQLTEGERGNLVSSSNKASSSRLFNHVVVTGESSNRAFPPVAAEAKNLLATSPSSIQRIGDRVTEIKSSLVTTVVQAQELANNYLRISSLEEFELDFSSIMLPWIEPGEILEILEPSGGSFFPTRYLISNLNFPLDLGPMSGNGKRVTVVL